MLPTNVEIPKHLIIEILKSYYVKLKRVIVFRKIPKANDFVSLE